MNQDRKESVSLPIACTLTPAELAVMGNGLLPGLLAKSSAREPIPGGFRWRFDPEADLVKEAAAVIDAEHGCCRFLRFLLLVEPGDGAVWLEGTGPDGTEDVLSTLLDSTPDRPAAGDYASPDHRLLPACRILRDCGLFCLLGLAPLGDAGE